MFNNGFIISYYIIPPNYYSNVIVNECASDTVERTAINIQPKNILLKYQLLDVKFRFKCQHLSFHNLSIL